MLRSFAGKIRKGISRFTPKRPPLSYLNEELEAAATLDPDDVMGGHFAVLAIKGEESKRFIVELEYLADRAFIGLLDKAKEEYGFRQKGVLAVPCRPQELQKILDETRAGITEGGGCPT